MKPKLLTLISQTSSSTLKNIVITGDDNQHIRQSKIPIARVIVKVIFI
jgi:ABC-type ATPase involved in cell division